MIGILLFILFLTIHNDGMQLVQETGKEWLPLNIPENFLKQDIGHFEANVQYFDSEVQDVDSDVGQVDLCGVLLLVQFLGLVHLDEI